eukprot:CAMPEP_0177682086 /NCGR_PEP_ID=MMETSP0447-20121125/31068_1 /TAXON_ID=0 /ORGANISM="Stygamoeba regulata, Strain BSH-02190019" /LENGTH=375 /DNA_ID=CAMNT_0019191559 /DNA_START=10 /DNA_END=1134 /DNA_ORIENTATION=+
MDEPSAVELVNKHMLQSFRQHLTDVGVPVRIPEEEDDKDGEWADHEVDWENDDPKPYETGLGLVQDRDLAVNEDSNQEQSPSPSSSAAAISAANLTRLEALRTELHLPSVDALITFLFEQYTLASAAQKSTASALAVLQKPPSTAVQRPTPLNDAAPATGIYAAQETDQERAEVDSAEQALGQWSQLLFTEMQVRRTTLPFGLPSMPPPQRSDVLAAKSDIEFVFMFQLPAAYVSYCIEIGHGTLGRCRVFAPCSELNPHDLRFHTYRLRDKFMSDSFVKTHKQRMDNYVVFANDVEENFWFGWRRGEPSDKQGFIYCIDESDEAPPPMRVARTFEEFITKVCLGNTLKKLGLKRFSLQEEEGASSESDDEDENP